METLRFIDLILAVWQIAQRDYRFGKGSHKSLTKASYDAIGNHFRKLWGQEAGWAHSVLFTADLRPFADRVVSTKKMGVVLKDTKEEAGVKTEVTASVALTATEGVGIHVKIEDLDTKSLVKAARGTKRKGRPDGIVHFSQVKTRRMSMQHRQ